ncbi:MAG: hypothetical protein A2487_09260 [Candidatus Raymondbacteria bacterium RifOxyC12_full_50_8]|uniref:YhcH/YjgK/YiaL family protein n=1 Tax=Candidatus Raymondbacteria bacterium RIFOXYD12_FULL_49_13 TaxID=1817890 RepID=A0A1F7FFA5_UNCRA|nr:MAG: hypothetical protein A2248_22680 [Candidatus Raymondbacteria bacterium RIFOXYA2_FULL_49_16]OGJ94605.1 MAG: hypothetical protein A2350_05990 [Candidatus Raymondbacteria bacterium RifOxyB12_full_50_8]OGJ98875.1 MAG: hypothetical protein A2487_09260 [Candidatus Raymondbacteria bacterium RifOxyC12_full_50_8]OGK05374.1 MAG: hypothetical protein A2519_03630 [Candidatus Raymondbacteria bacterium RIFOXYD12_FULL_49_13]OGP42987.1 MAG: hypothetical protein A2324_16335 [Candidatus Raymondbacteria b
MILDSLDAWGLYFKGSVWDEALAFVRGLSVSSEEKKYFLRENDLYAIVVSYGTHGRDKAILETHRKYIDVHITISGKEKLAWVPKKVCVIKTPYDESKDAEFYDTAVVPLSEMVMKPGLFAAFYPDDAHTPQLFAETQSEKIKKVVLKIAWAAAG